MLFRAYTLSTSNSPETFPPVIPSFCASAAVSVLLLPVIKLDCVVLSETEVPNLSESVVLSDDCFASRLPVLAPSEVRLPAIVLLLLSAVDILFERVELSEPCFVSRDEIASDWVALSACSAVILFSSVALSDVCLESIPFIQLFCVVLSELCLASTDETALA